MTITFNPIRGLVMLAIINSVFTILLYFAGDPKWYFGLLPFIIH